MTYGRATSFFTSFLLTRFCEENEVLAGRVVGGKVCCRKEILGVVGKGMRTCKANMSSKLLLYRYRDGNLLFAG